MEDQSRTQLKNDSELKQRVLSKTKPASKRKPKFHNPLASIIKSFVRMLFSRNNKKYFLRALNDLVFYCTQKSFLSFEEQKMINNIVNIDDIKVVDVMIPRTDIIAISQNADLEELREIITTKEHTRIPVYGENLDEITGFIHSKDLVKFLLHDQASFNIKSLVRKIIYVPHSMRIMDLLRKMRSSRIHIAAVLDEYGGIDGLITIEDIVEEIVGEIEDEHDIPDNNIYNRIEKISQNIFHVGGRVNIEKVENLIGTKIVSEKSDFETIGGFILSEMKKIPRVGEVLDFRADLSFRILDADGVRVRLIEITRLNLDTIEK